MSDTPQIAIYDLETDTLEVRDMSADELENFKTIDDQVKKDEDQAKAQADAKLSALSKLAALGLTQEEIEAL